jgi:hypothetical protein
MKIIYRLSPFKPDNLPVYFPDDKWKLVEMCHNSFLKAGGKNYDITYLIDSVDWTEYFEKTGKVINIKSHNKNQLLLTAYDIAMTLDDDVLFVEDDYLWRPDTLPTLENALQNLGVLSPYDHPAHYNKDAFDTKYDTRLIGNETYRTCPSNTHTFAIRKDILKENVELMKHWGVQDHQMFTELNKVAPLWCPSYSFATHLAQGWLAPNISWLEFANQ